MGNGLAGCLLAAVAVSLVVWIVKAPLPGDTWLAREMNGWARLDAAASIVNRVGDWQAVVLAIALGIAVVQGLRRRGGSAPQAVVLLLLIVPLLFLDNALKALVDSPRPGLADGIVPDRVYDSGGFPSGHTMGAVILYGAIASAWPLLFRGHSRRVAWLTAAPMVIAAGPSRIITGAHWPSDVIGGYLWGAAALLFAVQSARTLTRARGKLSQLW